MPEAAHILQDDFRDYAKRVIANAQHLASCLADQGLAIVTGGTDNHMVLVDLSGTDVTGADIEDRGLSAGISMNKNMVPGDQRSPRVTSGIRVGTAATTSRGMGTAEMETLADILVGLVKGQDPTSFRSRVRHHGSSRGRRTDSSATLHRNSEVRTTCTIVCVFSKFIRGV